MGVRIAQGVLDAASPKDARWEVQNEGCGGVLFVDVILHGVPMGLVVVVVVVEGNDDGGTNGCMTSGPTQHVVAGASAWPARLFRCVYSLPLTTTSY